MWNNQKQQKNVFLYVKLTNLLSYLTRFPKSGPTYRGKVVNPRHQTPQGQSVAKPGTALNYILVGYKHDIKESKGNKFNPIFKENIQGQKHPGSCVFAEPELLMKR